MAAQLGPLHQSTVSTVLVNGGERGEPKAANIEDALDELRSAQPNDTILLFVSGHGLHEGQDYYFVPTDAEFAGKRLRKSTAVPWERFQSVLEGTKGRRFLFLDTCRSGNRYSQRLTNEAHEQNIVIYAAARWDQDALERRRPRRRAVHLCAGRRREGRGEGQGGRGARGGLARLCAGAGAGAGQRARPPAGAAVRQRAGCGELSAGARGVMPGIKSLDLFRYPHPAALRPPSPARVEGTPFQRAQPKLLSLAGEGWGEGAFAEALNRISYNIIPAAINSDRFVARCRGGLPKYPSNSNAGKRWNFPISWLLSSRLTRPRGISTRRIFAFFSAIWVDFWIPGIPLIIFLSPA